MTEVPPPKFKKNRALQKKMMTPKHGQDLLNITLPETNIFAPESMPSQEETIVFQPSIFRCHVSFREDNIA